VEHSLDFALAVQRKLVQQWESFLSDIRKIDGFEDFLGIPSYGKLQVAARGGPIIFLNANKTRCDAIIMPPSGSPHLIPLEGISLKQLVEEHVAPLNDALEKGRFAKMKTIFSLLQFLWRALVYPITKALTFLGIAYGSRIWWCPSSAFTMLPIHAAGLYNGTSHSNLPDLFISSYISTASNLLRASSLTEVQYTAPNSRLLFVGHSAAGDLNINNELCQIQSVLPTNVKPLVEKKATPTTVTEDMAKFPWIHFSCHGNVVSNKPLDSCFHLEGGRLRVQDIIAANLPHAELAFLSACHSAAGGTILPDESMHLTSALQFAGFRSAVGTLWEMYDGEAPRLAKHFYSKLIELGGRYSDAAEALNFAIKKLRRRKDATPDRWAMFVHIGA
jgi:CHAT domain-containing protein